MSIAGKRLEIARLLSLVDGVEGYEYKPSTPKKGDAWPLWGGMERDEDTAVFVPTWRVLVLLPQDERAASQWIDEHHEALVDELAAVAFVDRLDPVNITANGTDQYALQILMRSE